MASGSTPPPYYYHSLGAVGNGTYGALIDRRSRVVWCCMDRFGGDPVFNSLLNNDSEETGFFDVVLPDLAKTEQKYIPSTAVLVTTLVSKNNDVVQVKDFAPRFHHFDRMFRPFQLFRVLTRVRGDPMVHIRIRPTFNYNSTDGYQTRGSHHIRYCGPKETWRVTTNASIQTVIEETPFLVHDPVYIVFGQDESFASSLTQVFKEFEDKTIKWWKQWCMSLCLPVDYQDILTRAAITLHLLQSEECGGIVNSLTTGIPLGPESPPTRDERMCHLMDVCLALPVLRNFGLFGMCRRFLEFLKNVCFQDREPQPSYGHLGEGDIPAERVVYLAGYRGIGEIIYGGIGEDFFDEMCGGDSSPKSSTHSQKVKGDPSSRSSLSSPSLPMYGLFCIALSNGFFDVRLKDICSPKLFERLEAYGKKAVEAFEMFKAHTSAPVEKREGVVPPSQRIGCPGLIFDDDLSYLTLQWMDPAEQQFASEHPEGDLGWRDDWDFKKERLRVRRRRQLVGDGAEQAKTSQRVRFLSKSDTCGNRTRTRGSQK